MTDHIGSNDPVTDEPIATGGSAGTHDFVPDPNDDEFCDTCGHPPADHEWPSDGD